MKGYGTKTFGRLNAERYDAMYEDLMSAETLDSVSLQAQHPVRGMLAHSCSSAAQVFEVLSLPIFPELIDDELEQVVGCIGDFFAQQQRSAA